MNHKHWQECNKSINRAQWSNRDQRSQVRFKNYGAAEHGLERSKSEPTAKLEHKGQEKGMQRQEKQEDMTKKIFVT